MVQKRIKSGNGISGTSLNKTDKNVGKRPEKQKKKKSCFSEKKGNR